MDAHLTGARMMNMESQEAQITQAASWLKSSSRVLCITGAGISADSGLPTYRGIGGLYTDGPTDDGIPIEQALSGEMLAVRPEVTWKYLSQIEAACRGAGHNDAHLALARLEAHLEVCILTQNIDGFHHQAGSENVIEIHGCFDQLQCMGCGHARKVKDYTGLSIPPVCQRCGKFERPNVVLFGEMLPVQALNRLYAELDKGFDLVMTIGTTSVFPYIAGPVFQAAQKGVPTIEINPGETEVSHCVQLRMRQRAAVVLPQIVARYSA